MSTLLTGIIASVPTFLLTLLVTNWDDVRYLLWSRRQHQHLNGAWKQYHLSTDSNYRSGPFWVEHDEILNVSCFGRVSGESTGRHSISLRYRVKGVIRHGVMRLTLTNQTAREVPATLTYPRLLSGSLLVGMWTGRDFDGQWSAGPIILSRNELTTSELSNIAARERILVPTSQRSGQMPALAA